MRKTCIVLAMLAVMIIGCQEEARQEVKPPARTLASVILPKTGEQKTEYEKWKTVFGDNEITQLHYNIAILLQIADQHGGVINTNRRFIGMVLSENDPNSLATVVVQNRRLIQGLAGRMAPTKDKTINLKTLEEHNAEVIEDSQEIFRPQLNGVACPKCGAELYDLTPVATLMSYPPQFETICKNVGCDYTGTRF